MPAPNIILRNTGHSRVGNHRSSGRYLNQLVVCLRLYQFEVTLNLAGVRTPNTTYPIQLVPYL